MLTFLFVCAMGLVAFLAAGILAIPILLVGLLVWLITIPFRLFFGLLGLVFGLLGGILRIVFGVVGAILGLVFAPVALLIVGVLVIGGLLVGLVSLVAPLIPVALLGLLAWAVYRIASRRPNPTF